MSFCISKDYNLQKDTLQFLYSETPSEEYTKSQETSGGILSNLNYAWLFRKSRVVVVNCKNGSRVGSWDFGSTLQDDSVEITTVEEIQRPNGREPHLIISLNCVSRGGVICIFDFVGSKIIRAIQIVEHITDVHVIDRGQDLFSLSGPLRNFDGVLAVGTVGGNVYILDICRQLCYEGFNSFEVRDELNPCQMQVITSENLLDIENYKKIALCNESHLAIFLNVVHDKKTEHFVLKRPDGTDSVHVNKDEVLISALHYCPQLGSILVGYNFGAYQLWNLMSMELVYTSPICEEHIPIIKFAIQEPADDPRAFCYVWAVYSTDDPESKILPYLVMFALCYESKEYHENYGLLYENFQYCTVRFQRGLGLGNNQSNVKSPIGGKCLRLESLILKNSNINSEIYGNDGAEDALSLCVVAWKAVCENEQFTYMSVFDLNQWYKAQMPNSSTFDDCASYMITLCISDLTLTKKETETEILDINLHKKTIQQFIGTQRLEEHYHPSSLSFETLCLLDHKIVNIQYQGVQRALLGQLQTSGPLCLIRPSDTYQEIVALGLTPLFAELNTNSAITSLNNQREVILNVALEQQLTSWLCKCASEWANGSFSSAGCSLDLLTSWAFRRAITLKRKCDYLCVPLFDYSNDRLDANSVNILSNCIRQIKNVSFVFSFILNKLPQFLTNRDTIFEQCRNLQMIETYFNVLQWFFNVGLLPEYTPLGSDSIGQDDKIRAPYPVKELEEYYKKRRSELLLAVNKKFSSKKTILFIDNLIKMECGGERLGKDWEKDGGDGFYPPRSLQALLRTYLLDGVAVCNKHSVIIYLLLDLAVMLEIQYKPVVTHLVKFPAVFKVSPSFIKITHAFWQLDHGEFHSAMEYLLDPMVNQDDLRDWHHKVALKSLLVQEQHNLALLYMNVRKPPVVDDEDVLCALSLFISNNMLDEAFYLEKNFKNYACSKKIIRHLFTECSNYGRLHNIICRNLTDEEETQFLKYLDDVQHPEAADLKITYFMQRSHFIEAFKTYHACEDDPMKKGLMSRLNLKARDQIVHTYKKFLPTVSYEFIESCTKEPNPTIWKEVTKPDPISVCVHKVQENTEYKSSLILAALAKAKLTYNESVQNISLMNATTEEIPFLRTPTLIPTKRRSSVQVIIPQVVENEEDEDEDGPSPPKRTRLSYPSSPQQFNASSESNMSILSTPIIVRKDRSYISPIEKHSREFTSTPTSILKVRDSYKTDLKNITSPNLTSGSSTTPSRAIEHKSFLSGRKSTRPSVVRFDVPSTSSEEQSSSLRIKSPDRDSRTPERNESISFENSSKSNSLTPKNVSDTDDVYYSPDSSLNNIEELPKDRSNDEKNSDNEIPQEPILKISPEKPAIISEAKLVKLVDYDPSSSSREGTDSSVPSSPRGRRSYKKPSCDVTPIRSSPRLSRSHNSAVTERERGGSDHHTLIEEQIPSPSIFGASHSRKSLNRQVLEANTLARLASDANIRETTRTEVFREEKTVTSVVEDNEKTVVSFTKTEYSDRKYSYTAETSLDSTSGENATLFVDNPETPRSGTSDTFMEELYHDLRKRHHLGEAGVSSGETSSEKPSNIIVNQTPLRITRRMSRRLSEERTSSSSESFGQLLSENKIEEKSSRNHDHLQNTREQSKVTGEILITSSGNSTSDKYSDFTSNSSTGKPCADDQSSFVQNQLKQSSSHISTPQTGSVKKIKPSRMVRCRQPLSRRVLENSALEKLVSSYDTSSTEEENWKKDIEMLEDSKQNFGEQSTLSISDSFLEDIAFGVIPKERELIEKCKISIASSKYEESDEKLIPAVSTKAEVEKGNSPTELNKSDQLEVKEVNSLHNNLKDDNEQNNIEPVILENSDDVGNQALLESIREKEIEQNQFGQEDVTPTVFERNISSSDLESWNGSNSNSNESTKPDTKIIEISSSDESRSSRAPSPQSEDSTFSLALRDEIMDNDEQVQMNDVSEQQSGITISEMVYGDLCNENDGDNEDNNALNKGMMAEDFTLSVGPENEESSMASVILISESNEEDTNVNNISDSHTNSEISSQGEKSKDFKTTEKFSLILISKSNEEDPNVNNISDSHTNSEISSQGEKSKDFKTTRKSFNKNTETEKESAQENATRNKPVRRMTRRSSKQSDDQEISTQNESFSLEQKDQPQNANTENSGGSRRGSISRQSTHNMKHDSDQIESLNPVSEEPMKTQKYNVRKRTRSVDMPLHSQTDDINENTSKPSVLRAKRKLRSSSFDISRTKEEEVQIESITVAKSKKKPSSMSDINIIGKEDEKSNNEDFAENYRANRRLTRRQSTLLEQSLDKADLSAIETQVSDELLDKTDIKGASDHQVQEVCETSPSSTASVSRGSTRNSARKLKRTSSNVSNDSDTSNVSSPGRRKSSVTRASSQVSGVRRTLRSASTDEKPESKSTRRAKEKTSDMSDDSADSDTSVISTRSRKSNTKIDDSNNSTKRKRKVVLKSALPEIKEENLEGTDGSPAQNTRRGRKNIQK